MLLAYRKNLLAIAATFMVIASINNSTVIAEDELVTRARQLREVAIQKRENEAKQALTEALRLSKFSLIAFHEKMKSLPEISTQLKIFVKMAKRLKLTVALMNLQKSIQIISRFKPLEDLASFKITSVLNPNFVPPVPI